MPRWLFLTVAGSRNSICDTFTYYYPRPLLRVCTIVLSMLCLDVYECIAMLSSPMYMLLKVQPGFTGFEQM